MSTFTGLLEDKISELTDTELELFEIGQIKALAWAKREYQKHHPEKRTLNYEGGAKMYVNGYYTGTAHSIVYNTDPISGPSIDITTS